VQDEEDLMTAELVKRSPMPTFDRARTEFGAKMGAGASRSFL
jgi:hypothetical protein